MAHEIRLDLTSLLSRIWQRPLAWVRSVNTSYGLKKSVVLQLVGPFQVTCEEGVDLTPRGRKACALLAILALSPNMTRSRKWLQDRLWSDRGEEQGAASLRQSLAEIRRCLGARKDCLIADRGIVALSTDHVQFGKTLYGSGHSELLEGMDLRDQQFEEWLRQARAQHQLSEEDRSAPAESAIQLERDGEDSAPSANPKLVVIAPSTEGSPLDQIIHDALTGAIGQLLSDTSCIDVHYGSSQAAIAVSQKAVPTVILRSNVHNDGAIVHIGLHDAASEKHIWSRVINQVGLEREPAGSVEFQRGINLAANMALEWLAGQRVDDVSSAQLYIKGIKLSQRHTLEDYQAADICFRKAHEITPSGIHLAWRAYIRSFMVAELMPHQRSELLEETRFLCATALERDPYNSLVLSLCAHVQSTVFLSYSAAYDMASQSMSINGANPLAMATLATAQSHSGELDKAIAHCRRARKIAGTSPFRAHIDILSCIVAVMSGDFSEARHYGEAAHASAPTLAAPLRFLMPLYFEAGNEQKADEHFKNLRKLEPSFNISHLREKDYPCESLRKSRLIELLPSG